MHCPFPVSQYYRQTEQNLLIHFFLVLREREEKKPKYFAPWPTDDSNFIWL